MTTQDTDFLWLTITEEEKIACDVQCFKLTDPQGTSPPLSEVGPNPTVVVPNGIHRSYSLYNDSWENHRYVIAAKHDGSGRGGSMSLIDGMSIGGLIDVFLPRNELPFDECAKSLTLVADGIGITSILPMARQLKAEGLRDFELYYLARDPEDTAFPDELSSGQWRSRVKTHHDLGDPTKPFDSWTLFECPRAAYVYYCGPQMLMDMVRDMTGYRPPGTVYFESSGANNASVQTNMPFITRLKRTDAPLDTPADRSILDVLCAEDVYVTSLCESGTCGSCRTALYLGEVDHQDMVLRDDEKATQIMACISRAKSGELVPDLRYIPS